MQPDESDNPQKKIGSTMIMAMWILLMLLLGYLFNHILDAQHNPNQNLQTLTPADGVTELELKRNRYGHYVSAGQINGYPVTFMLDTGATDVSVPADIAHKIGLPQGRELIYQTANGNALVYATQIDEVALGGIKLSNIRATINPNVKNDDILLGMSFLKHLEFSQRGDSLTLRQYSDNF
ncbi:MAG: TIGR02281 family clan AA aspartic protease [Gammaproteobacteria bacterium]|nr:TIGR02281 family clan AA aspartic protease [Gammaproteobacteria bacterium]